MIQRAIVGGMQGLEFSSDRLRQARQHAGLTMEQAAATAGCALRTLSRAERGEGMPGAQLLGTLADVYAVSVDDFFHRSDSHTSASAGVKPVGSPSSAKKRAANAVKGA